jgi:restriction endonuclease S subunit
MSEWKEYRLGDFAEINMGQSPKSELNKQILQNLEKIELDKNGK